MDEREKRESNRQIPVDQPHANGVLIYDKCDANQISGRHQ